MASGYLPKLVSSGDLIAELAATAPKPGANTGVWPGLTVYRFTGPAGPSWEEIQSLSLCIVAQGRKAVTVDGQSYLYDPFHYLVLNNHVHFQAEILEASVGLLPAGRPVRRGVALRALDQPDVTQRPFAVTRRGRSDWPPLALVLRLLQEVSAVP